MFYVKYLSAQSSIFNPGSYSGASTKKIVVEFSNSSKEEVNKGDVSQRIWKVTTNKNKGPGRKGVSSGQKSRKTESSKQRDL